MDDTERKDEQPTHPRLLLFPLEHRPWTGIDEARRFMPERVVPTPNWLTIDEADRVNRYTWDLYVDVLRSQGYMALKELSAQLEIKRERARDNQRHFYERQEEARADEVMVWLAHDQFGADAIVDDANGWEGWHVRGVVLSAPREHNQKQKYDLTIDQGTSWKDALAAQVKEFEDWEPRLTVASNMHRRVEYLDDVCAEVLRHYEGYTLDWKWDEYGGDDGASVAIDPTDSAIAARYSFKNFDALCSEIAWVQKLKDVMTWGDIFERAVEQAGGHPFASFEVWRRAWYIKGLHNDPG